MRILALVLLLTACTATEPGTPAREEWLTGQLTFRKVEGQAPTSRPSADHPVRQNEAGDPAVGTARAVRQSADAKVREQALGVLDCAAPDPLVGNDDPVAPLVTCDAGEFKYDLGPVFLDGDRVAAASAEVDPSGAGFVVTVEFDAGGARTWSDFTTANVGEQVAILINGRVLSAPTVQSPITGGSAQISGGFTRDEADQLARQLVGR
ncbi:SecDF P1 head subdomain-containing protein [Lentzea albida]|uniref:Preprotein translocase subunit SecD n=1 Tax=Lentzea albida TaxID=65499 RepID=A0A1H9VR09_9PSEU|nr:hypothetical protein [Lentzea albida]SES23797.1 preprotein translocase subunit SecD [Lentzea albida]